ncbi:MAG: ATPase with chaperone activity [Betaproteobacteria bacterium]|nr:ATPase with chaperone activity [Betaproteobacteria bacterium]
MSESQIQVPESYLALFQTGVGRRLTDPWHHILWRYESCEDLAQGLVPQARALVADLGVTAEAVAPKLAEGLHHPSVGLAPEEVQWVCTRLIELLEHGL